MTLSSFVARRVVMAFAAALLCGVIVFALPRFVYNSVTQAFAQQPAAAPAPAPQAAAPDSAQGAVTAQPVSVGGRLIGLLGMAVIIGVGWALSRDRKAIRWKVVGWGVGLQVLFAIFVLRIPQGRELFRALGAFVTAVLHFSYEGSTFVFGKI